MCIKKVDSIEHLTQTNLSYPHLNTFITNMSESKFAHLELLNVAIDMHTEWLMWKTKINIIDGGIPILTDYDQVVSLQGGIKL